MPLLALFSLLQFLYLNPIIYSLNPSKERGFTSIKRNNNIYNIRIAISTKNKFDGTKSMH
jgi:hypothetical protein